MNSVLRNNLCVNAERKFITKKGDYSSFYAFCAHKKAVKRREIKCNDGDDNSDGNPVKSHPRTLC